MAQAKVAARQEVIEAGWRRDRQPQKWGQETGRFRGIVSWGGILEGPVTSSWECV